MSKFKDLNTDDGKLDVSVPLLCVLGLPYTRFRLDKDPGPIYVCVGRSCVDPTNLIVEEIYTGSLSSVNQYHLIWPPQIFVNDAG